MSNQSRGKIIAMVYKINTFFYLRSITQISRFPLHGALGNREETISVCPRNLVWPRAGPGMAEENKQHLAEGQDWAARLAWLAAAQTSGAARSRTGTVPSWPGTRPDTSADLRAAGRRCEGEDFTFQEKLETS